MQALITGGAGFVGRHISARLAAMGYHVTIVDSLWKGSGCLSLEHWPRHLQTNLKQINLEVEDCRRFFASSVSTRSEYDVIVHLAAVVGGRLVIEHDPLAVAVDLAIDADFFYWLSRLRYRPRQVHYFSSSAAYPIDLQKLGAHRALKEEDINFEAGSIGMPDLTYGWAKLTGEYLARLCHQKHGHSIICYRPFSGYGEDQDPSYPFPAILRRAVEHQNPMTVWGTGRQMRDFIYIEDCVDGMLKMGSQIQDGRAVNLSTGRATSFNDFAELAFRIANGGLNVQLQNTASMPEGVFARYGSTVFQEKLGFRPQYSLEDGIRRCLALWGCPAP